MKHPVYTLEQFVDDLRRAAANDRGEPEVIAAVRPLARRFALADSWRDPSLYRADPEQGFGAHLLHEEPDHRLAVFAVSWLPARGAPPHDHGTWAIVVGVDGTERNVFFERTDDRSLPGHAQLRQLGERVLGPGEVLAMPAGTIHGVTNDSAQTTLSLHVYGKHINFTRRSQFDLAQHSERPFIVKVQ